MNVKELSSSVFMLVVAIVFWYGATKIPVSPLEGQVGAAGFPKLLAASLGALAIIRLAQTVLSARRAGERGSPAAGAALTDEEREAKKAEWRGHGRAAAMLLLGVGYVVVLPFLGYLLSLVLLIVVVTLYSGRRPSLGLAAVAIVGAAVLYVVFVWLLQVPMPAGIWPELGLF